MQRFSIITDDLKHCIICGKPAEIHEIYFGSLRKTSIKYGLTVPLCDEHHRGTYGVHGSKGRKLDLQLKKLGQRAFEEKYDEDFLKVIGRNYL